MNKILFVLSVCLFFVQQHLNAQSLIKGEVVEGGDITKKLSNASIVLLNAKDSILLDFTRADENGKFSIAIPDTTASLLIVTYPKFGSFYQEFSEPGDVNIGQIALSSVDHLIEEVIVTGKVPVVIKGDTIEYDASSFTVEKNAKVEDLLKVLPGLSVDADGKITAQGKTVEKVLVDGEEFFGDDPTLVTRNIRSDMVDKVQVYEKKSEEAERTGVDDGSRTQTINVTLKEDAKKGIFGKVEGAAGKDKQEDRYLGKLAINKFNGSQKIGAFFLMANDGNVGLDWAEEEKFGLSGDNLQVSEDGGVYFTGGSWDEFSRWDGRGSPKALNTGFNFNDNLDDGKHKINIGYKYGTIENQLEEGNIAQNNLESGQINTTNSTDRHSDLEKHRFNGKYDWKIDSLSTITFKVSGSTGKLEVNENTFASTMNADMDLVNTNQRAQSTTSENSNVSYDTYYTRKFKKAGRSLSLRLAGNHTDDDGESLLQSLTSFYESGQDSTSTTIDQLKDIKSNSNNLRTSATYTEPLTKALSSSLGYEYNNSRSSSSNDSYNQDNDGNYTEFDTEFSNDFDYRTIRNAVNLTLKYKVEKIDVTFNNSFRNDNMFQENNYEDISVNRDFFTYNPNVRITYNITKNKSIGGNYSRYNNLPSLSQIQPLKQNTDPLNIIIGNESLTPSNTDNYSLYFNNYNMLKGFYLYVNGGWRQTRNSIQQNVDIDPQTGVRYLTYQNLEDYVDNNGWAWAGMGFDLIKKHKIKGSVGVNANYRNNYNFINSDLNENTNFDYGFDFSVRKNTTKNIDFRLSFVPGWRKIETSLQPEFNSSGFTYQSSLWYSWHLPLKISLYGDLSYDYEAPTKAFDEKFERVLFKPGVSRKFLKDESLVVDFYVNDIFNENVGFRRYQSGNMITQNTYNTISRYFMLKVSWDFTTMKGGGQ